MVADIGSEIVEVLPTGGTTTTLGYRWARDNVTYQRYPQVGDYLYDTDSTMIGEVSSYNTDLDEITVKGYTYVYVDIRPFMDYYNDELNKDPAYTRTYGTVTVSMTPLGEDAYIVAKTAQAGDYVYNSNGISTGLIKADGYYYSWAGIHSTMPDAIEPLPPSIDETDDPYAPVNISAHKQYLYNDPAYLRLYGEGTTLKVKLYNWVSNYDFQTYTYSEQPQVGDYTYDYDGSLDDSVKSLLANNGISTDDTDSDYRYFRNELGDVTATVDRSILLSDPAWIRLNGEGGGSSMATVTKYYLLRSSKTGKTYAIARNNKRYMLKTTRPEEEGGGSKS